MHMNGGCSASSGTAIGKSTYNTMVGWSMRRLIARRRPSAEYARANGSMCSLTTRSGLCWGQSQVLTLSSLQDMAMASFDGLTANAYPAVEARLVDATSLQS